jgi:hypothetical protein
MLCAPASAPQIRLSGDAADGLFLKSGVTFLASALSPFCLIYELQNLATRGLW